jgi:predicted O-methyltransferase YrrM
MNYLERAAALGIQGFLHPSEADMLAELATGRDVCEIGAYRGLSCWCMAQTARSVISIDSHRAWTNGQTQGEELTTLEDFKMAVGGFPNVSWIVGTSKDACNQLRTKRYDMIFLDAMHTYEDCLEDITRWWPKLRRGGVFAGHDYRHADFPGVEKAFDEVFGPAPDGTTLVTLRWIVK